MFGIGTGELLLLLIIALVVFGPDRLPGLARDIGKAMGELRKTSDELTAEFLSADLTKPRTEPQPPVPLEAQASTPEHVPPPRPEGEVPTAFDQEAQRSADEAYAKAGQAATEQPEPVPHQEAERSG